MEPIAAALRTEVMRELAHYYADLSRPTPPNRLSLNTPAIERGKQIVEQDIPSQRVPICIECLGPGPDRKNPNYPELAGQYAEYLVLQLTLFKKQQRGGTAYAHLMRRVAHGLTPQQIRDVAIYYKSLSPNGITAGKANALAQNDQIRSIQLPLALLLFSRTPAQ